MIPPMLEKFHKGQLGRVAVIGGSEDYTGAPYFSAMASARLGCDMVCFFFLFSIPSLRLFLLWGGGVLSATHPGFLSSARTNGAEDQVTSEGVIF